MKIFQWKSPKGNFGDDLNSWLWPRLFDVQTPQAADVTLIAIGSVLSTLSLGPIADEANVIVFGAGTRGDHLIPRNIKAWDIRFVRGPKSAASLGLAGIKHITDPAACLTFVGGCEPERKEFDCSFIPYYATVEHGGWQTICDKAGIHLIDPRWPVGRVIKDIASSERILTESLHGAIVADTYRVPWRRVVSFSEKSEGAAAHFKWTDWGAVARG